MQAPDFNFLANPTDPAIDLDLHRIATAYDPSVMTGTDAVRLAADLVAAGFQEADALAFTWPVTSRNILKEVGRTGRGPNIETWDDLGQVHAAQLDAARGTETPGRIDQLARMVVLCQTMSEAAAAA